MYSRQVIDRSLIPVVQEVGIANYWINLYPLDNAARLGDPHPLGKAARLDNTHPLDISLFIL